MAEMSSRFHIARVVRLESVGAELEAFVGARFDVAGHDAGFHRETRLWDECYVDSTGALELFAFLEARYQLSLPEDVLFDPEFTTLRGMARCVSELLGG